VSDRAPRQPSLAAIRRFKPLERGASGRSRRLHGCRNGRSNPRCAHRRGGEGLPGARFSAASLREIASEAGLTTGAVYSNFDGKADLFLAVLEEKLDPRLAAMYEAGRTAPQRRLGAAVGREFAAYVRQRRRWLTLLIEFWAQAARDPKLRPKFAERHGKLRSAIADVLSLALPAEQLATVVIALTNGMAVEQLADPHGVPEEL
jgi:AcrR family transcriptional regulator